MHISGRFQANSGDVLLPPALRGCGLILAPDYLVAEHLKAGRLVRIMPDYRTQETPVYAVYPSRNPSAKTRTFVDFVAARFGRSQDSDRSSIDGNGTADVTPNVTPTVAPGLARLNTSPQKETRAS